MQRLSVLALRRRVRCLDVARRSWRCLLLVRRTGRGELLDETALSDRTEMAYWCVLCSERWRGARALSSISGNILNT
jgi:hypothetical protein